MRRLRILVEWSRGKLPVLVASAVVPVASCSDADEHAKSTNQAGRGGLASDAAADTSGPGGASGVLGFGGFGGSGAIDPVGGAAGTGINGCYTYTVSLPPAGIPASPGQICPISTEPIASNRAARITLTKTGTDIAVVEGHVAIEPMLAGQVRGLPTLSVLEATEPMLSSLQVTEMVPGPGGFSFRGTWPQPLYLSSRGGAQMTLKATFDIACDADAQDLRSVEALTTIHACIDQGGELEWVSSGDDCTVCRIIAEMAPSPIVPDKIADGLPLAQAIRLRLIELARVGDTVVLLAENDGGTDVEYEWQAGSGALERLAPDIVAWTMPGGAGPHHVQTAVFGKLGAAVASYSPGLLS